VLTASREGEGLEGAEVSELGKNDFRLGQDENWVGLDVSARSLPGFKLVSRVPQRIRHD